jgi:hypothetical protein
MNLSIFRIIGVAIVGLIFIFVAYAFDNELRTKYHESAPMALGITGGAMALLSFLGYAQQAAFKQNDFFAYIASSFLFRGVLSLMFAR